MQSEENPLASISEGLPPGVAKVLSAAAGGLTPGIKDTSADIWGALVGDRVKLWRIRNWISGLEKTAAHIERMGLDLSQAKPLPYGDMLALFDGISKEDDADLSDLWARLIAGAMSESDEPAVSSRSVASVLEQMSPDAAKVFFLLAKMHHMALLDKKIQRLRTKEFFPLTESEETLDERNLTDEKDRVIFEIDGFWTGIKGDAQLDISKSELLRLNLIQAKVVPIAFDDEPFSRGVNVNKAGLDMIVSDLVQKTKELVDNRTLFSARPFREVSAPRKVNFELSVSGIEIAKKLSIF
ncbi:DUF4393 domain-containing protein [Leisingera daeponensis]|uniref:DUF4393 domain-containing protein n=1 Tax=Leisingera daeponensis TaxID=405746 RepID=A0ABS7NKV2_9RHOB|nr:Abi-alpha family protein [Leisingera daeponensis]MBY6141844.1 DUF4393 domain-containing protein [Leisingera daeponensis]